MTEKMKTILMYCPTTKREEFQEILREDDDGMYLKCVGCGKTYGKEIGELY